MAILVFYRTTDCAEVSRGMARYARPVTGRLVVLSALLALAGVATGGGTARRTAIATWNPFDAAGAVKPSLKIKPLGLGSCSPISEVIGEFGYRCGADNLVADPCWRDGPHQTDLVVCPYSPWDARAATIRVPHFMLASGVTFAARVDLRSDPPWGLELENGNRCLLAQGAHDSIATRNGHRLVVDYFCDRDSVVLMRNLRRGRVWRIGAARWTGRRYRLLGDVVIRRAIFPSLPPPMQRQNDLARAAAAASGLPLSQLLRVRISFPALDWANVEALAPETSKAISVWVVVHRAGRSWSIVHVRRPVCRSPQLPASARRQLFGCGLPRPERRLMDTDRSRWLMPHLCTSGWWLRHGAGSPASRLPRPPAWAARDAAASLGLSHPQTHPGMASTI